MKPALVWTPDGYAPKAKAVAHDAASFDLNALKAWTPRRGTSADADLSREIGPIISRTRDIDRNDGVARGAIQTIKDNVVGTGLRLSARPDYLSLGQTKEWAVAWSRAVESLWCEFWWSTACDAGDVMNGDAIAQQHLGAKLLNGAGVALVHWIPDRGDGFSTKLQTIEIDRLSNPDGRGDSLSLRGGVEIDTYGRPLAYWIRKTHPGDLMIGDPGAFPMWDRVPRKTPTGRLRLIHDIDRERPGQSIGKPLLTAILPQFRKVGRYTQAELDAAITNGLVAGIMTTPLDQDNIVDLFSKDAAAYQKARMEHAVRLEGGSILPLFPGDDFKSFVPGRPATAFGAFVENIYRVIGVGLDLPIELLLKDFTKSNYSSARAALLEAWRMFNRRRDSLGTQFYDPIYALFLEEVVNDGRVDAPDFYAKRYAYQRCKWIGPGRGWVDPLKEAQAAAERIVAGVSTLEDECADQGKDWREVIEQLAYEMAERKRLGLPDPTTTSRLTVTDPNSAGDQQQNNDQQQGAAAYA